MPKKNNPGCTCCGEAPATCTLLEDDFNRSDDTDVGSDWDEVVSGASISSNKLAMAAGAVLISTHPHSSPNVRVSVTVNGNSSSRFRIIVNYVDIDNYYYSDLVLGGDVTLGVRSGGSETTLTSDSSGTSSGGTYSFEVCVIDEYFHASIGGVHKIQDKLVAVSGEYGLAMPAVSSTPTFDDFLAESSESPCEVCGNDEVCGTIGGPVCIEGTLPTYFEVTVSGVSNGSCTECDRWNDTFLLEYKGNCIWLYYFADMCGYCFGRLSVRVSSIADPTPKRNIAVLLVLMNSDGCDVGGQETEFEDSVAEEDSTAVNFAPIDCANDLPTYTFSSHVVIPGLCDFTDPSVTITVVPIP